MTKIGYKTRKEAKAEAERLANIGGLKIQERVCDYDRVEWENCEGYTGEGKAFYVGEMVDYIFEDRYMIAYGYDERLDD